MPFISENELEKALVQAVKNPASAPDFYRLLLESDLLVMGTAQGREDATEVFTLAAGGRFNLVTGLKNGGQFLPVFSSMLRMQDYVKKETKFLRINGRALLDMTRGGPVILNPASEYGKEFSAREVAQLLDGGQSAEPQAAPVTGELEYPIALVEVLNEVFTARRDVVAAWMVNATFADAPHTPRPLVGVEFDAGAGDWPSLMQQVEAAAQKSVPGVAFDLQRMDRTRPNHLTDTLLQVPPFYQRRAAGSLLN